MRAFEPIVLICDADMAARETAAACFADAGMPVRLYAAAEQLLADYRPGTPTCVVLCGNAPAGRDLDFYGAAARGMDSPVIQIVEPGAVSAAVHALRGGAIDVLEKPVPAELLITRVRDALMQAAERRHAAAAHADHLARLASLTERERYVLEGSITGHTAKHIADRLGVALRTVQLDREHILEKMQTDSLVELACLMGRESVHLGPPRRRRAAGVRPRAVRRQPPRRAVAKA